MSRVADDLLRVVPGCAGGDGHVLLERVICAGSGQTRLGSTRSRGQPLLAHRRGLKEDNKSNSTFYSYAVDGVAEWDGWTKIERLWEIESKAYQEPNKMDFTEEFGVNVCPKH